MASSAAIWRSTASDEPSVSKAIVDSLPFGAVAADLETQVRIELARKVAASNVPVQRTARRLAMDVIEVARPVIERSKSLSETDLLDVIKDEFDRNGRSAMELA